MGRDLSRHSLDAFQAGARDSTGRIEIDDVSVSAPTFPLGAAALGAVTVIPRRRRCAGAGSQPSISGPPPVARCCGGQICLARVPPRPVAIEARSRAGVNRPGRHRPKQRGAGASDGRRHAARPENRGQPRSVMRCTSGPGLFGQNLAARADPGRWPRHEKCTPYAGRPQDRPLDPAHASNADVLNQGPHSSAELSSFAMREAAAFR